MSDYIDRENLIERLKKAKKSIPKVNPMMMNGCLCGLERAIMETIAIPATDVSDQKHGKWQMKDLCQGVCSECGFKQIGDRFNNTYLFKPDKYKYCPNCGADMRQKDGEA